MTVINHLDYQIFTDNRFNIDLGQNNTVTGINNLCTGNNCTVSGNNVNTTTKYTITDYDNDTRVITCVELTAPAGTLLKVVTPDITFITKSTDDDESGNITLLKELDIEIGEDTWYCYIIDTTELDNKVYIYDLDVEADTFSLSTHNHNDSYSLATHNHDDSYPLIVTSIESIPSKIGNIAIVEGNIYVSTGISASGDWTAINQPVQ